MKAVFEPVQSALCVFSNHYNSGMLAGDTVSLRFVCDLGVDLCRMKHYIEQITIIPQESAMLSRWSFCCAGLYAGMPLVALSKQLAMCVQQSVRPLNFDVCFSLRE